MREIKEVILHCTDTPKDRKLTVKEIRNWHVKGNGWEDIGYHFIIHQDGKIERARHIDKVGAHTWGNNYGSIGVAYCGGAIKKTKKSLDKENPKSKTTIVSKDTMTKEQEESFRDLFEMFEIMFGDLKLRGHNDYNKAKDCPGFNMRDKFGDLMNR
jgi:N-acetylmuramoyl-L-alanine amidase